MTLIAHEVSTKAMERCSAAAEHALPVNLCFAVFIANFFTGTYLLKNAILAQEILGLGLTLLNSVHLLFAVDEATEVRLLAPMALIEGASVVRELLRLTEVNVLTVGKALVTENSLLLGINQGFLLDHPLETKEGSQLGSDGLRQSLQLDLLLAARARHESESNAEGCPLVLEELHHTVGVKNVAAGQA